LTTARGAQDEEKINRSELGCKSMNADDRFPSHSYLNLRPKSYGALQVGAALSAGILLGVASFALGPFLVLMGLIGVLLVSLAFIAPEIVVLIMLAFVLELIPAQLNPSISLLVGHFFVTDLLLIVLLLVIMLRYVADRTWHRTRTPLDQLLLLFCVLAIIGLVNSVLNHGVRFDHATPEARVFLYYLLFFAVTNLIKTRDQLVRLIVGILFVAAVVAGSMAVQAILGRAVFAANGPAVDGETLVRAFNPGFVACYVALTVLICDTGLRKDHRSRLVNYLLILLLGLGLVTTLARNLLIAGAISLSVLFVLLHQRDRSRLGGRLLILAGIALFGMAALLLFGGEFRLLQYLSAYSDRASRMFSGTILSSRENVLIRWDEVEYAWQQITKHPILGIGFTTPYRPPFYLGDKGTYYIHNAYLWIWLKTGLLGLAAFLGLSFRFLQRGFQHWRDADDSFLRAAMLGFTLAYLGMMITNLVAPSFVENWNAAIFAVIMGIGEAILTQKQMTTSDRQGDEQNARA
jgi:O-antigen ligase